MKKPNQPYGKTVSSKALVSLALAILLSMSAFAEGKYQDNKMTESESDSSSQVGIFGGIIFSNTYTGEDLLNSEKVSFPTRAPRLVGTGLLFPSGEQVFEKLVVMPLISTDLLDTNQPFIVSIRANLTRLTEDFDPGLLISDGSTLFGIGVGDNDQGTGVAEWHLDADTTVAEGGLVNLFSNAGFPPLNQSFDVAASITISNTTIIVAGGFLLKAGAVELPGVNLNVGGSLEFVLLGKDPLEEYQINSVTISVAGSVNPPHLNIRVSEVEISWQSIEGQSYLVEYATELNPEQWEPLAIKDCDTNMPRCIIPGDGRIVRVYDGLPHNMPRKFYRLVVIQEGN